MRKCALLPFTIVDDELLFCFEQTPSNQVRLVGCVIEMSSVTLESALKTAKYYIGLNPGVNAIIKKGHYTDFEHFYYALIDKEDVNENKTIWLKESEIDDKYTVTGPMCELISTVIKKIKQYELKRVPKMKILGYTEKNIEKDDAPEMVKRPSLKDFKKSINDDNNE